ncbi:MAG: exo-alpha-sialidase, partial [bacterium]|nr:exo-alpha-sialidase [bacterium]
DPPTVVLTTQKLLLSGSDIFYGLHCTTTNDQGRTWTPLAPQTAMKRHQEPNEVEAVVCDFTPKWHAATKTLLGTGHIARYKGNRLIHGHRRGVAYATYDTDANAWRDWHQVTVPDDPAFFNSGAGSGQRYDLPNGDILVPVYHAPEGGKVYATSVLRCTFDGEILSCVDRGNSMSVNIKRGLYEPSVTKFGDRFYLTLRNDDAGYVTVGDDGLHFEKPIKWTFDDGQELGNYNTQQHWILHPGGKGLFLAYTRRGANNDHVFRHRAPLFIAQVDPERLCVMRATERILVPQRGARLGNFAIAEVSDTETWATVAEWMQPVGCEKYGSDNSIYAARVLWKD